MPSAHVFDANTMDWTAHPRFADIRTKVFETRLSHPMASVMLVELGVAGEIPAHFHEQETETVYILGGQGLLAHGDVQTTVTVGMGASIPPGIPHSLRNTGDIALMLLAIHMPPIL
jgi:mannose-6-phosphate isomerase-like protein (cupin superfamily)